MRQIVDHLLGVDPVGSGTSRKLTSATASARTPPTPSITVIPNCGSRWSPAMSSRLPRTIGATSTWHSPSSGVAAASSSVRRRSERRRRPSTPEPHEAPLGLVGDAVAAELERRPGSRSGRRRRPPRRRRPRPPRPATGTPNAGEQPLRFVLREGRHDGRTLLTGRANRDSVARISGASPARQPAVLSRSCRPPAGGPLGPRGLRFIVSCHLLGPSPWPGTSAV